MSIERSAGILLPIFSLPSKYGIGTLGKEAYRFIDFLVKANQSYWQMLPVGHTSYGDSPYQCFSSFAGNPYFIDPDLLAKDGLLDRKDLKPLKCTDNRYIDYGWLYQVRYEMLYQAYTKGKDRYRKEIDTFVEENQKWIKDYALFMAVKKYFDNASWLEWPDEEIRLRKNDSIYHYRELLKEDIDFYCFIQYLFFKQFLPLKEYANKKGIRLIGDLPIYVAMDSCEVWADSRQFQLKENDKIPENVAGVPPDYFSKDGQLWGNPLYNWDYMKSTGYKWWIDRIDGVSKYFDVIRIDHFRGFEDYWSVPYGEKTARNGCWQKGPSIDFIRIIRDWFCNVDFIAEDLGIISKEVTMLLQNSGFPGMKVLEFSLSDDGTSTHIPHHHTENSICYISTHDNVPIMGWMKKLKKKDLAYAKFYYGLNSEEAYNESFIRAGMNSVSKLFITQIQDYLGCGEEATINRPGSIGNWRWRLLKSELNPQLSRKIKTFTHASNRDRKETIKEN